MTALLRAVRPRQWTKNGLVFAGVLFSNNFTEPEILWRSAVGFAGFCFLSGLVYLVNDLQDLEVDRLHPVKRLRPLAAGDLSPGTARIAIVFLTIIAAAISWSLGMPYLITAAGYLAINILYSSWIKRVVLLDVILIAMGFVLRAIAGVELIRPVQPDVALSPWLLVCTFFLALYLGFGKRRQELVSHGDSAESQRRVLSQYSVSLLDSLTAICAATTLVAYSIYTIWPATVAKVNSENLLLTVPFVAFGIFRYMWLVNVRTEGEDPSQVLVQDRPLLINIVLWGMAVILVLFTA